MILEEVEKNTFRSINDRLHQRSNIGMTMMMMIK